MAFIHVVKPKMKNNNPIMEIEITVFRVDNEPESIVSIIGITAVIKMVKFSISYP